MNKFYLIVSFILIVAAPVYSVSFPSEGIGASDMTNATPLNEADNSNKTSLGATWDGNDLDQIGEMSLTSNAGETVNCIVYDGTSNPSYAAGDVITTSVGDFTLSSTASYNGSTVTAPGGYLLLVDPSSGEVALGYQFPILKLPISDAYPFIVLLCLSYGTFLYIKKRKLHRNNKLKIA